MFIRSERSIKEFFQLYPVVSWIVIINLALWLIISLLHLPIGETIYMYGTGNNYLISQGEYWRLITPIFLHGGLTHVLFNSFSLVLFGPALEQMLGKFKFVVAYLVAGFAGNLGTYLLGPEHPFYSHVGASGAIFGLFGIYLYMIFLRKDLMDQSSSQIILVIAGIGVFMTFLQPNVNIYGHIFGLIGGMAIAPLILVNAVPYWAARVRQSRPKHDDGTVSFDPNRWNKKRRIPRLPSHVKKRILWIVLGGLVVLGLLNMVGVI